MEWHLMGFGKMDGARQDKRLDLGSNGEAKCFLQNLFREIASFLSWLVVAKIVSIAPMTTPW
jgi:hypothetical protein